MLDPAEWQAIRLTLFISAVAILLTLPVAILLGWVMAKKNFWGKLFLEVLIHLPLVLPPVATGYLLLVVLGRQSPVGVFFESLTGVRFIFDWKGAAIASSVVAFPLMFRPIRLAFEQVDDRLLAAAKTLGASPRDAFFSIALPLATPGILAGCILGFARSMGEFGATIMVAGNIPDATQTISLLIYSRMDAPGGMQTSWRLVIASIVLAAAALFAAQWLDRVQLRKQLGKNG